MSSDGTNQKAYIDNGPNVNPTLITEPIKFVNMSAEAVLSFNVYKQVSLGGDVAPGKQRLTFELPDVDSEDVTVAGNTIETNGAGAYSTAMTITVPREKFYSLLAEGFTVKEKNENASGWTYDETEWYVVPTLNDDDGTIACQLYNLTAGDKPWETQTGYNGISFANTYTQRRTVEEPPVIPETGDNSGIMLYLGLAMLSAAALVSALASAKRRCK